MENESAQGKQVRFMWVSKPVYESLPYFYLTTGALCLGASMYVNHWHWPTICFVVGLLCLVAGMVVLLKRRDYRVTDRRVGHGQDN
jgi:hypothetical protein